MINEFNGENFFLSNFFIRDVTYHRFVFPSTENAYQAAKTPKSLWHEFLEIKPNQSKHYGKVVALRPDWEEVKQQIMYEVVKIKFEWPDLRLKLLITGEQELIEGNYWGDRYWGVCNGVGQNNLGKILMRIRNEIRLQQKLDNA